MTLRSKILIGYGIAVILMILVVVWAIVNLVSLGQASEAILRENYRSILAAGSMINALERQDSAVLLILSGRREEGIEQFQGNEVRFLEWLARAKDNITIPGESAFVESIDADFRQYLALYSVLITSGESNDPAGLQRQHRESLYPLFEKIHGACTGLRELNEKTMHDASSRADHVSRTAIWSTSAVASAAGILALLFSIILSGRITRPIVKVMEASRKVAGGDYSMEIPVETRDELGRLVEEFNGMSRKLAEYHAMNVGEIIAARQKAEAILKSMDDGLIIIGPDLKVTDINPAACGMLDRPVEQCLSADCRDIIPDRKLVGLVKDSIDKGKIAPIAEEARTITTGSNGIPRHLSFSLTFVPGRTGELASMVLILRDITRLKEVERLKSEFVMAASHELRTPLTSMGMSIDLLFEHASDKLDDKDRELLQAAHEEVHRLKALVNDLLDLSRIEAGRIDLQFENVPIALLAERVETVFKGQLEEKAVKLTYEFGRDLPDVYADATKATWVLTNLVSNALRYVPQGGHITIRGERTGSHVFISVNDNGPGIPPEYQTKLFQKFVQVKGRETGGTGLGLAICREIVRAHGGSIWVDSEPGRGSTFTFTLPVAGLLS